jgi:hypothetical protein
MGYENRRPRSKVIEDAVRVETTVPREISNAIDTLVAASGVSKYAFLRQVLIAGLQPYAITNPDLAAALQPTTYERKQA